MNEITLSYLLEAIAAGLTLDQTRDAIPNGNSLSTDEFAEGVREALNQGVEREDIAPSFLELV